MLAASGAIYPLTRGNGTPFFRDGPRLVLVSFLATSSIWGLLGFIATLVNTNAASGCQVVVAFAASFDQVARVSVEQFLLWTVIGGNQKLVGTTLILQGVLIIRFVLGAVFVGLQRPQFNPVCVATNLLMPMGIAIVVVDSLLFLVFSTRGVLAGMAQDIQKAGPNSVRSRALLAVTAGFGIWTAVS